MNQQIRLIKIGSKKNIQIKRIEEIQSNYYIRAFLRDQSGVLEKVARVLGKNKISIRR